MIEKVRYFDIDEGMKTQEVDKLAFELKAEMDVHKSNGIVIDDRYYQLVKYVLSK